MNHSKVTFTNRYGVTLAADMYVPKNAEGKLPAIAVSGPFGAVKEQSSGLYAQTMAERGFVAIAFDPSLTGESGGEPRYVASPDINTEDFSAAVDFLSTRDEVDPQRIGIIGICGWGGFAINAAAIDTRIKATVASTMYDISRAYPAKPLFRPPPKERNQKPGLPDRIGRESVSGSGRIQRSVVFARTPQMADDRLFGGQDHPRPAGEKTMAIVGRRSSCILLAQANIRGVIFPPR